MADAWLLAHAWPAIATADCHSVHSHTFCERIILLQVVLCSACSGHGFKMSSTIGEHLAGMVLRESIRERHSLHAAMAMHKLDARRPGHAEALEEFAEDQ